VVGTEGRLLVATGDGALEVLELQPAGKRRMAAADWLRGAAIRPGDVLVGE
jgi:methionyl-tRNA formyltransferase